MPKAFYVITGTEAGKKEITGFYQIPESRIKVLPLPTPSFALKESRASIDVIKNYGIKGKYIFYPAQFWAHKNHIRILLAVQELKLKHGQDFSIVFTGSDKGNQGYIRKMANECGLEQQTHFLGFVDPAVLLSLYKNAFALVFPTFFGPDNLPPLEAFALGCPVIASKLSGATEQLGDAALLVDPEKESEIAEALLLLLKDENKRKQLIEKGLIRSRMGTANEYALKLLGLVTDFEDLRKCWKND